MDTDNAKNKPTQQTSNTVKLKSGSSSCMIGNIWSAELVQTFIDIYPNLLDQEHNLVFFSNFVLYSGHKPNAPTGH